MSHELRCARPLAWLALTVAVSLAGCSSAPARPTERLPFHLAVVPPVIERVQAASASADEGAAGGSPTDLQVQFDSASFTEELRAALSSAFVKVSVIDAPSLEGASERDRNRAVAESAATKGADIVVVSRLEYDPKIETESSGLALNLICFAVGGPLGWFVPDRGYSNNAKIEGRIVDVAASDAIVSIEPQKMRPGEVRFVDRADGAGHYLVSLVCPTVFLAPESTALVAGYTKAAAKQLANSLVDYAYAHKDAIIAAPSVDFFPRNVNVIETAEGLSLTGEVVLGLQRDALNMRRDFRYRLGAGEWQYGLTLGQPREEPQPSARKVYDFKVPLGAAASENVQLEFTQLDQSGSRRTFTFAIKRSAS